MPIREMQDGHMTDINFLSFLSLVPGEDALGGGFQVVVDDLVWTHLLGAG